MKFIIHNGEDYYPSVEEFDDCSTAKERFDKLVERRRRNLGDGFHLDSDIDYLAIVIDSFDANEYNEFIKREQKTCKEENSEVD